MEKLSSLHERTKENMGNAKQSTAWAKNQDVVNMLSEDPHGNLLYKGNPVYNRPYESLTGNTGDWFLVTTDSSNYVSFYLFDTSLFEEGREIKDFFLVIDGDRFSVKDLSAYDDTAYVVNMNKLIMSRTTDLLHVVTLASKYGSDLIARIANYESFEFELELYK